MLKGYRSICWSVVFFFVLSLGYPASAGIYQNIKKEEYVNNLDSCTDTELKFSFLCHFDWQIHNVDDAVIIVISEEDPIITLTVSRFDSKIRFLAQITPRMLKERNLYQDGFRLEEVEFAQRPAIKVKAFARDNPKRRLVDYFFIQKDMLHGVLFTVQPKEAWEEEQFLIKKVIDSVEFFE